MFKFAVLISIGLFIVMLSAVLPISEQPIWYGQYLGLLLLIFTGVSLFVFRYSKMLAIFLAVCLYSTFFVAKLNPRAMIMLLHLSFMCLAICGISKFKQKERTLICFSIIGLVFLQSLWLALQSNNIPILANISGAKVDLTFVSRINPGKELVGFSGSKDQLGSFFALSLPICLGIYPPLALLSFVGLLVAKSSFALVSGVLSGFLYAILTKNKQLIICFLVIGGIATGVFFSKLERLTGADFLTRSAVLKHSISCVNKGKIELLNGDGRIVKKICNKFNGFGFGQFAVLFPYVPQGDFNYPDEKFNHAHNDFIEAFFELGYIGLVVMVVFIISFIIGFIYSKKSDELSMYFCCLVAYLLNANGNFVSQMAVSGMLIVLFYGMYLGAKRELNGKDTFLA